MTDAWTPCRACAANPSTPCHAGTSEVLCRARHAQERAMEMQMPTEAEAREQERLLLGLRVVPGGQNQEDKAERVETLQRARLGLDPVRCGVCCPACLHNASLAPCSLCNGRQVVSEAVAEEYANPLVGYYDRKSLASSSPIAGICLGACFGIAIWYALWSLIGWRTLILAALIALACGVGLWIGTRGEGS